MESWLGRKSIARIVVRKLEEESCCAARRRGTVRVERREGFELERVVSCSDGERRWRAQLNFCSGEPFDDHHRSTTLGAAPEIVRVRGVLIGQRFLCCAEQVKAEGQESGASPVGQETKVADAYEAFGEQVQQEAAQEFIERDSHELLFVVVSRVAPAKSDLAMRKRDQAMVGDGYAVGVAAQILEHVFRATEGWFCVDHPIFSEEQSQPGSEGVGLSERSQVSREVQLAVREGLLEASHELAAKDSRQRFEGKKKPLL